jgi:hypothetical protein
MRKVNYKKILLVVFITVLIWVWTDLALDEDFAVFNATASITKSTNPQLWVSFGGESTVHLKKVILRGPVSRIAEVRRKINEGTLAPEFFLNPEEEGISTARQYVLNVAEFLRRSDQMKQLGLTVKSCEPAELVVDAVELVKATVPVRCIDEEHNPVKAASIEPAQAEMYVPKDWSGEKLAATVMLGRREMSQARSSPVEKTPYIELSPSQIREATSTVRVMTAPEESRLSEYTITTATLGIILSPNLEGKYKVELTNLNEVIRSIAIRATAEAKKAYDKMHYQVILEIDDSDKDVKTTESLRRELIYNFPPEYVRKDEIMLNQQPAVARFNLVPISGEAPVPAAP